jgi:hypothetical protein
MQIISLNFYLFTTSSLSCIPLALEKFHVAIMLKILEIVKLIFEITEEILNDL